MLAASSLNNDSEGALLEERRKDMARIGERAASIDERWLLVAVCFLALALSFSVRAVLGLVMPDIEREFGATRSTLSSIGATALIVMAFSAPFAGAAIDRFGPRLLLVCGMAAVGAGSVWFSAARGVVDVFLAFGVVAAIGFAMVATNVAAAAVGKRFDENRGLAIGIATAGATAGQLVFVPIVAFLSRGGEWREGFSALGMGALILALICFLVLRRGATGSGDAPSARLEKPAQITSDLLEIVRTPAFHLLFWSFLLCGFTTTGVIETHFLPYAAFCGFPPLPSASAYGVLSFVNLLGMIAAGWLSDRVHRPGLLGVIYMARAISFIVLIEVFTQAPDIRLLFVFAILFGIFDYSTVPATVSLAATHLGIERLGLVMGLISAGHAIGGAAGAFVGGAVFDVFGRYVELWTVSLALSGLAGLIILFLPDRPFSPTSAEAAS